MKKVLIGSALTASLLLAGAGQSFAATNQDGGLERESRDRLDSLLQMDRRNIEGIQDLLTQPKFDFEFNRAQEQSVSQEESRVLNRAVRLLKEETGLRDLVNLYRNALLQG